MPLPVRRDYIRERQSTAAAGAWTINVPRPTNALEGDWIVAVICLGSGSATPNTTTGWNQILIRSVNTRSIAVYARKYEEDDPSTYPLAFNVTGGTGAEVSSFAVSNAADFAEWTIGTDWRRQDNGGSQAITQSPSITAPVDSLVFALEIEATNAIENDGSESISGATKWYGSPNQTTASVSIERVLVSYIDMEAGGTTGTVTTTWPNAALNGAGIQIAIPTSTDLPPVTEYALDTFERTVTAGGWGAADIGGNWTTGSNAGFLSVSSGTGHITIPSASSASYARLESIIQDDVELYAEWSVDKLPSTGNARPRFVTRYINGVGDYHVRASVTSAATADFRWYRDDTAGLGSMVTLPTPYTPGDILCVRAQTFPDGAGGTRLRARMWYLTDPEPTAWTIDLVDSTPGYQVAGVPSITAGIGAGVTNLPIDFSYDNFRISPRQPDATSSTGNIGLHVVPHFTQTSLRVGAKFLEESLVNEVQLFDQTDTLLDTKTATVPVSKWANVEFTGLTPDTEYTIKFVVNGTEQTDASFVIKTLPNEKNAFTIVAGSCQFTGSAHPVFTRMAEDNPLFIAHMGDLQYQNATDETSWRAAVESSLASSTMGPMLEKVPFSWTWDNHDRIIVDTLNMGTTSPNTAIAWHELAGETGWTSSTTMGRSWTAGRVRFIQTDQWSVRDDPDLVAEPRTFLGATQKQWWKDTLLAAEEPVIVWFCQWTAQNHANGRWNSFNAETAELEAWLNAHPSVKERLIMVGGDSHQLQADSGTRTLAQGSRFVGVPSLNVSGFNRSSTGANGLNWDIAEGDVRLSTDPESDWGAYSRLTFTDNGHTIDMLWEAVRVNAVGATDILASWRRKTGTVTIDGKPAVAQYYRADQSRIQPLSIEMPE